MANLTRALGILKRMAHLLDTTPLASGTSRYERVTNAYEDELISAYQTWVRYLLRELNDAADDIERKRIIGQGAQGLLATLQRVGQANMPLAANAIGIGNYAPSPDAWRMIAEAIDLQNADFETRLIPFVLQTLERGVDEGTDLRAVADSLTSRVAYYAGGVWIVTQRLVGDFVQQAATRDDLIYRVRWVRTKDDHSCQSCIEFEGEYDSYEQMLQATNQCVPGYFVGSPYKSACWLNCRCYIEVFIDGKWVRV